MPISHTGDFDQLSLFMATLNITYVIPYSISKYFYMMYLGVS